MENEKWLIDKGALIDTIEGINWYHIDKLGYLASGANSNDHTPIYKADDIYTAINNAPTVDAVEVVHGRWVMKETMIRSPFAKNAYCSVCLEETGYPHNYCPNCGAKMDGGNEGGK